MLVLTIKTRGHAQMMHRRADAQRHTPQEALWDERRHRAEGRAPDAQRQSQTYFQTIRVSKYQRHKQLMYISLCVYVYEYINSLFLYLRTSAVRTFSLRLESNSSQTSILRVGVPGALPVYSGISHLQHQILIGLNQ